jgi:chemotaxis regulatin CheY-phosphate phosphatase CheZ
MYENNLFDIDIAMEEAAELIRALSKLKRNLVNDPAVRVNMEQALNNVVEEIADVRYTLNTIIKDFKLDENEILNVMVEKKRRTRELLKKSMQEPKPLPTYWEAYKDDSMNVPREVRSIKDIFPEER